MVGTPVPRVDGADRVSGTARYTADLYPPGLLYGAMLRSPHAHARITRFDASKAEAAPGVRLVLSAANAPKLPWFNGKSWLFDPELRYVGDEVALAVAESPDQARDALDLIQVEYEALPHVIDAEAALRPGAVQVFADGPELGGAPDTYERGDLARGFAEADVTIELSVDTQDVLHHSMETHGSVAHWDGDQLTIWDSTQHIFGVRRQVSSALKVPLDRVRVVSPFMGGGFGSKNGAGKYTVMAAFAAKRLRRPVKIMFTRAEESQAAGKRPRSAQRIRIGAKRDGTLTAIEHWAVSNVGAYRAMGSSISGPTKEVYLCPNMRTEVHNVFTHGDRPRRSGRRGTSKARSRSTAPWRCSRTRSRWTRSRCV